MGIVYTNVLTNVMTSCHDPHMNTNTATRTTGYLCKNCGAMSPQGIGYAASYAYAYPAPAADCLNPHA